jgi:hypothetical protein
MKSRFSSPSLKTDRVGPAEIATEPVLRFYRAFEAARAPQRADRSAAGTLPTRAFRYCDAATTAAGFGWYVFAPIQFSLLWDGDDVFWTYPALDAWLKLETAQLPDMRQRFDEFAPHSVKGCAPPFLSALVEPGVVQIWTGLFARTMPGWSLNIRPPANLPQPGGFVLYEGIVETDRWFGPLFTNVRMTRTDVPVRFSADMPLIQVQPLPRTILADSTQNAVPAPIDIEDFTDTDWSDYRRTIVVPNDDPNRIQGNYAATSRRNRRAVCPFVASGAGAIAGPARTPA